MKKSYLVIISILVIIGTTIFVLSKCTENQEKKIAILENKLALLKEENVSIKFKILEKQKDSIKVAIKLFNSDNKSFTKVEKTLFGQELSFDFFVVKLKNKYLAFPFMVYTNKIAPIDGEDLLTLYDKDGFPEIYDMENIDTSLKEKLSEIFKKIKNGDAYSIDNTFGNMVHDMEGIKSFEPNIVYKIVSHTKGGIEVIEN